jgi:type IX secretion system PorP/SprF family membrane protein
MKYIPTVLTGAGLLLVSLSLSGQNTPYNPISGRVFTPFTINPAAAGSKDFTALDLSATIQGEYYSQLLSGNSRIAKKGPRYFGAPVSKSYTRVGIGAALFNDVSGPSRNLGINIASAYHIPLNDKNLSFLSAGVALKGIYNMTDSLPDPGAPSRNAFIPNVDAGIYLYGQKFHAGVSATNILGSMTDSTDMSIYNIPVSRQYFLIAGYKIVLSKSLNIILEPSIIVNIDDSLDFSNRNSYNPMLKLYMDAFCVGSYLHSYDNLTFFFQYKFPNFYLGTLVDFPRNVPFYKRDITVEIAAGFNFGGPGASPRNRYQW